MFKMYVAGFCFSLVIKRREIYLDRWFYLTSGNRVIHEPVIMRIIQKFPLVIVFDFYYRFTVNPH